MVLGKKKGILTSTTITFLLVSVAVGAIGATYFYSSSMGNNGEPRVQITNLASEDVLAEGSMELRGTAAHENGAIQAISVRIDGGPPTSVVPNSINDFSEWSVSLPISSPGNHTIEVEATDENGKIGSTKVSVVVKDAASVITAPPDQIIEATGSSGALAHYPPAVSESTRILGEPDCSPASGSIFPIGITTVTCSASYAGGNTVSANFTVSVRDTTAPTIVAPTDVVAKNTGLAFTKMSLGQAVVNDAVDENPAVSNNAPANGFELGTTAVVWTASDDYGNKATATQKVTVTAATSQDGVSSSGEATRTTFVSTGGGGGGGGGSSKSSSNSNSGDKDDNGVNTGNGDSEDGSGNNKGQNGGGAKDTTAPSVAITNPANGATVSLGTLALTGTASDNSGGSGVNTVQVRIDGGSYIVATPKASGDWSTWSASLDVSSAGSHTITARATDKAGNQRTSSITVTVPTTEVTAPTTDDSALSVAILQPEADSIVTLTEETIVVTGTASDSGSGVNAVEVRIDDGSYIMATPKAEDDWSSWSATLPITAGDHRIVPRATDIAGNQAWNSIDVTFVEDTAEDTTSPSVAITSPADGSTVTLGSNAITIQGTASDSGSGVSTVEVRIGDGSYSPATPKAPGDWSTWSISLPVTDGEHRLVPRATDNAGNQAWNSIYVTVTSPTSGDDSTPSSTLDDFGIEKIYPTTAGGNEWYVNMDDPTSDPLFRNLPSMTKQSDGSWQVNGGSRGQVRMEAWSPSGEKWLNVEITGYAKMVSGSNELIQWYSRGGHHTSSNECLGSAVKARLYGDGEARWVKEISHPAYTGNRGSVQATNEPLEDRWIGFKAVMYNFVENGNTYVRMESYIDDDVTGANGNLVIDNNWQLASVVEDRGGWSTGSSDFNPSCSPLNKDSSQQYRQRDEILNMSGGTSTQNIAAWRSDDLTWNWMYLSVREVAAP